MRKSYVRKFDRKMKFQGRNVVLILDNCPAHPQINGLTNTKMAFLPPNTTAETQPMDAGVIHSLKQKYRVELSRENIQMLDAGLPFKVDLLTALQFLDKAWRDVSVETIRHYFRHVGFSGTCDSSENNSSAIIDKIDTEDCDIFDNNLATCESPFEHAILSDGQQQSMESGENCESEDCDGDPSNPILVPSANEALKTLDVLERYLSAHDDGFQQLRNLNKVSDFMMKTVNDNRKQATITDYFH